jgi:glycosyltransferase involved in cell wall biosynthesis
VPDIALVVITDGRRSYLSRAIGSMEENLPPVTYQFIVDDSGDPVFAEWLEEEEAFANFVIVHHPERRGCSGAVRTGWELAMSSRADYVWHAEDDFTLMEPVDFGTMLTVLEDNPYLAQLALKRPPHGPVELAVGDLMAVELDRWEDHEGFCDTDLIFTFNPCLIPRDVIAVALADPSPRTEPNVTSSCLAKGYRFGYLGQTTDPPRVQHIGERRMEGWLP